jgi:hypothetical protein
VNSTLLERIARASLGETAVASAPRITPPRSVYPTAVGDGAADASRKRFAGLFVESFALSVEPFFASFTPLLD